MPADLPQGVAGSFDWAKGLGRIVVAAAFGSLAYLGATGDLTTKVAAAAIFAIVVSVLIATVVYAMNQTDF